MGFSFTRRAAVKTQIRHIAIEQAEAALADCRAGGDLDKTVHGLRRRCKKLRGLLRLIEPKCKAFALENELVRDAAQGLSVTRDAAVMVETFEALAAFDGARADGPRLYPALKAKVHRLLRARVQRAAEGVDRARLLPEFAAALAPLLERAPHWAIDGRGFAAIGVGLERTYERLREGMARARDEDSAEALHDWRKQAKYHWHHVGLLHRTAPDVLQSRRTLLDELGELLGDHHNLHVLHEALAPEPIDAPGLAAIGAVVAERQAVLATRAFDLGRQLTVEKPAALRRRFEQYWQLLPETE